MAILTVLMCFASTNAFAQLKEVRGVQTKRVKYDAEKEYFDTFGDRKWSKFLHGFEFKNENNYAVWIEAELCTSGFIDGHDEVKTGTYDTKDFTLMQGESYVWKCGKRMVGGYYDNQDRSGGYFVKYKAYKAE